MGQIVKEVHKIMMTVLRGRKGMESYPSGIKESCYSFAPRGPLWEVWTCHMYKMAKKLYLPKPYEPLSNTGIIRRIKLQDKI